WARRKLPTSWACAPSGGSRTRSPSVLVPLLVAGDPGGEDGEGGVEQGEVGAVARGSAAELVVEAEVGGGVERDHAQALLDGQTEEVDAVADGGGEVDVGAGEDAVLGDEPAVLAKDRAAEQLEGGGVGADRRHRVGDDEDLAGRLDLDEQAE